MSIIHEPGPGGLGGRSTRALSISALLDIKGFSAIDLGSKEGYNSFDLRECGVDRIVGVEIREEFLGNARREANALGCSDIDFRQADVRVIDELGLGQFDLCLCSGLLYHMQNPFNLLKRMRNICRYLVIETHVAPAPWNLFRTGGKYRCHLELLQRSVVLDGERFRGRLNVFPAEQDMNRTSGSVVSHATFWLSLSSLLRALDLAGFDSEAVYFDRIPAGRPAIYVDHGVQRSKVFLLARNRHPERIIPVVSSCIECCPELISP